MQRVTRAAFVVALKKEVSGSFPFQADETFEDWVARAREIPNPSRRAMLAARMGVVKQRLVAQYSARKSAWIASARLTFQPGPRKACYVCGGFGPITQAHHVIPLNEQFDLGFVAPDHEHEWLCPNHHVILHLSIDRSSSHQKLGRRAAPSLAHTPLEHFDRLMELVGRAGRTTQWPDSRSSSPLAGRGLFRDPGASVTLQG
ncbi:HNH endonuclease [Bradyrhizobium japonicum]|uniref:HNH endonuclease n=1 Tax=Bradyrhizobium japonicum TaxID=375 RepID=UPI000462A056|nr:HNH endonuclease [Bradyrhizobium japonicum]